MNVCKVASRIRLPGAFKKSATISLSLLCNGITEPL